MGEALVAREAGRAVILAEALDREAEQRRLLMQYVKQHMVEGTDYGVIPGTKGNTLLKPGAEKLAELFRCTTTFKQTKCVEDWDRSLFHYEFECVVESRDTGAVLAHGVGSANSRESKWRWRNADRVCPNCGKPAIIRGKAEYGGGWLCFKKKDGCGAKFRDDDESITSQAAGRVENPDVADSVNSILKIAKKRALVDAVVALARCSDLFTQDLEDFDADPPAKPQPPPQQPAPAAEPPRPLTPQELGAGFLGKVIRTAGDFDDCYDRLRKYLHEKHPRIDTADLDRAVLERAGIEGWKEFKNSHVEFGKQAIFDYLAGAKPAAA